MKERPILFSAPMVQAILTGNKTQTRRVVKNKVEGDNCTVIEKLSPPRINVRDPRFLQFCPYGQVGDRLWVRETWATKIKTVGNTPHEAFTYRATEPNAVACYDCNGNELPVKWKPSIFMPRAASRILLEITGVRVERLHDISEQDAIAEGIGFDVIDQAIFFKNYMSKSHFADDDFCNLDDTNAPKKSYFSLWESINGRESLDANPWVWVITFKVVELR